MHLQQRIVRASHAALAHGGHDFRESRDMLGRSAVCVT
jgi:hypothetical protein